jgi:hypothetical protein
LDEFKFKFEFSHAHPSHVYSLFFLLSLHANWPRWDLPSLSPYSPNKILTRIYPLSFPCWTRGRRRSPRASLCQTLSSLSPSTPPPLPTPVSVCHPCWPPRMTPCHSDRARYPSSTLDIAIAAEDAMFGQDTTDATSCCHFATRLAFNPAFNSTRRPGLKPIMHPLWPCQPDTIWPPGASRACVTFRHACVHFRVAPHPHLHGITRTKRRHPCPAPWCTAGTPPRTVLPAMSLNPPA